MIMIVLIYSREAIFLFGPEILPILYDTEICYSNTLVDSVTSSLLRFIAFQINQIP